MTSHRRFQHYVRHTRMITKIYNTRIIRVFYFLKNTHVFLRILFFHTRILEPWYKQQQKSKRVAFTQKKFNFYIKYLRVIREM
jgi:hypothetical protein